MLSGRDIAGTVGALTVLAALFTAGRFVIHWRKNHKFRWDDWLNALALLFLIVFTVLTELYVPDGIDARRYALGLTHRKPTKTQPVDRLMSFNIGTLILFFCTIYAVKASFLALYWQIFEISERFRIAWLLLTAYTAISFVVSFVTVFTRCGAPQYFDSTEKCNQRSRAIFVGYLSLWCILNVLGDIFLMILPISILRPLMMGTRQKIGLSLVFALVLIIVALDILRTVYTLKLDLKDNKDTNAMWTILEPAIAVIVCALPCYRGLLNFHASTNQDWSTFSGNLPPHWSSQFKISSSISGRPKANTKEGVTFHDFITNGNNSTPQQV